MAQVLAGVVEAVSSKTIKTKYGDKPVFAARVSDQWIDLGFKNPKIEKGQYVELDVETNQWGKLAMVKGATPKTQAAAPNGVTHVTQTSTAKEYTPPVGFPVPLEDKGISICRQNALTNAVNFLTSTKTKATVEDVITTAAMFADWTTGNTETKAARQKLAEMFPDLEEPNEE